MFSTLGRLDEGPSESQVHRVTLLGLRTQKCIGIFLDDLKSYFHKLFLGTIFLGST
jgi:hypothetical protein